MKIFFYLIILLPFIGFSQTKNDDCIKTRWIAVQNDSANQHLFDSKNKRIDSVDVFQELKKLVEDLKLRIYSKSVGFNSDSEEMAVNYSRIVECWNKNLDSMYKYDPFFEFIIQSDIPLVDDYGDPMIYTDSTGTQMYMYPNPERKRIILGDLYELRIREDKVNDQFVPTTVSFCVKRNRKVKSIFWVNLQDALNVAENEKLKNWIQSILDKKYNGFQYMQSSCDDKFNR